MFQKNSVSRNNKLERGISRLSIEKLLSQRTESFRREPISVSLISSIERFLSLGGLCQDFP